jgi:hypothetical protein
MSLPGFERINGFTARARACVPEFIRIVEGHGEFNPILSPLLEQALGLRGEEVRAIDKYLRNHGHAVCSGVYGYYYTKSSKIFDKSIVSMEARFNSLRTTIAAMRRTKKRLREAEIKQELAEQGILL